MAKQFEELSESHIKFIEQQHMFFVASAGAEGFVNVSPKGMDSLRVVSPTEILWLNLTGSGNETAAHILENRRMTVMLCSFTEKPLILRVYGEAEVYHPRDEEWSEFSSLFPEHAGRRQIYRLNVQLVQTSCGFAVPLMDFVEERDTLGSALKKIEGNGIEKYWREKNAVSLNGKHTGVVDELS